MRRKRERKKREKRKGKKNSDETRDYSELMPTSSPDLNQGPSDLQSDALPTELSRQLCEKGCKSRYLDVSIVDDCSIKHYLSVVSNISILIP